MYRFAEPFTKKSQAELLQKRYKASMMALQYHRVKAGSWTGQYPKKRVNDVTVNASGAPVGFAFVPY